ncbi:MAG: SCP2 sterol-binding domain-containing protein [Deltaproteobacteria bacterium]|jgi:putative sterol carrier protein|nr:SCP2 sterol-binding domain-containing protein [Deltaproteobacteria bacterium]
MADIRQLFNVEVPAALSAKPDEARAIGGKYQLNITGAGNWTIDLVSNPPTATEGEVADAGVTITVAEADFQTLLSDPGAGMKLFFAGKLKVKGNQMLAMNLQKLLKLRS